MKKILRFVAWNRTLQRTWSARWKRLPFFLRWPLAFVRQLPITIAVARLPLPYNFAIPFVCVAGKTISYQASHSSPFSLLKYYFKTLSRTLFGFSLRRFLEQTARYTLAAEWGISEETLQAVGLLMFVLCVVLDALD